MESYLPTSDRQAASWIFSDGPSKPLGVVKLRYNALKLFFYNVAIYTNVPVSAKFRFISIFVYVARGGFQGNGGGGQNFKSPGNFMNCRENRYIVVYPTPPHLPNWWGGGVRSQNWRDGWEGGTDGREGGM